MPHKHRGHEPIRRSFKHLFYVKWKQAKANLVDFDTLMTYNFCLKITEDSAQGKYEILDNLSLKV